MVFLLGILLLTLTLPEAIQPLKEAKKCVAPSAKQPQEDCALETNYEVYVNCIRQRAKRSTDCADECDGNDCGNSCDECSCDSCETEYSNCCDTCCTTYQPTSCTTNHCCHKTCHATCRTSSCRSSCRKSCYSTVKTNNDKTSTNTKTNSNSTNVNAHNITTVIHLNNLINNTNIIDAPIRINTTNFNNISIPVSAQMSGVVSKETQTQVDKGCCSVMTPRQCVPQEKFPFMRCFHMRYNVCGKMCQAPIMHAQPHEVCDEVPQGAPSCHQQVIYVPQPQPRCAYTSNWPYVSCGIQQQTPNCGACYDHFFNKQKVDQTCNPYCYDDGYGMGSLYRQGPFYRPGFSAVPNCAQTGTCDTFNQGVFGGYSPYTYENMFNVAYKFAGNQSDILKVDEPLRGNNYFNPQMVDIHAEVEAPKDRYAEITIDNSKKE